VVKLQLLKNQLQAGYVVILPYLLTEATQIDSFKEIADEVGCPFCEIYIEGNKEEAVTRLLERGRWGEAGSPLLTEKDRPGIEKFFDLMEREMLKRKNIILLKPSRGDVDATYQRFLSLISD
jgi:hypothetical protein